MRQYRVTRFSKLNGRFIDTSVYGPEMLKTPVKELLDPGAIHTVTLTTDIVTAIYTVEEDV